MRQNSIIFKIIDSPIGDIVLGTTSRGCCLVEFVDRGGLERIKSHTERRYKLELVQGDHPQLDALEDELHGYFTGTVHAFTVPLDLRGTRFEESVWQELLSIPYGQTTTYGEIAKLAQSPLAFQAVGRANGRNPLAIVVPCHRVLEKGGGLCGYGGGVWRKKFLLDLEKKTTS